VEASTFGVTSSGLSSLLRSLPQGGVAPGVLL
jgi:hypothetical protein